MPTKSLDLNFSKTTTKKKKKTNDNINPINVILQDMLFGCTFDHGVYKNMNKILMACEPILGVL